MGRAPRTSGEFQPRYVAYAAEQGRTPAEQLAHDKALHPGACMVAFLTWNPGPAARAQGMRKAGEVSR